MAKKRKVRKKSATKQTSRKSRAKRSVRARAASAPQPFAGIESVSPENAAFVPDLGPPAATESERRNQLRRCLTVWPLSLRIRSTTRIDTPNDHGWQAN